LGGGIVTRYNYRQSSFERLAGRGWPVVLTRELRAPLIALAAAILIVAAVNLVEVRRLAALDTTLATISDRLTTARREGVRADRAIQSVAHLRALQNAVLASRRETVIAENTIARIGNHVPGDTWLTNVQATRAGSWSIAGRSTHVERIGAMLASIGAMDRSASTRLVSITASGARGNTLDFVIGWETR
jgi:hypothetical protein